MTSFRHHSFPSRARVDNEDVVEDVEELIP